MRKIFIDCGAYNGNSIKFFKDRYPGSQDFEIYAFEPNPSRDILDRHPSVHFYRKAVWIFNGYVDFFNIYKHGKLILHRGGSIIKPSKDDDVFRCKARDLAEPISVPCIDFCGWIKTNFDLADFIVLKMDIEGGEYAVIDNLISTKTYKYIKQLFVEWHPTKVERGIRMTDDLKHRLQKLGLKSLMWEPSKIMEGIIDVHC